MEIKDLKLNPHLLKALDELGFISPTHIQEKCIPEILQGKDVFGHSSTGSGKTAAFGLPILENIHSGSGLKALILTPTRELCVQVTEALRSFAKHTHIKINSVYGGVGIEPQIHAIKSADIVVGTPGRILDHIERKTIILSKIKFLVLDEADKMFEMGFVDSVEQIIGYTPKERQTLLFSATVPPSVHKLVKKHLKSPIIIKSQIHIDKSLLKQLYYVIKSYEKFSLLIHLLRKNPNGLALIFCATRRETDIVARNLLNNGIQAMPIHGGLTQNRRLHAIDSIKSRKVNVLVATDVAARGLDIKNISHVYNYDVPKTPDEYIHRIGRTARAGENGDAVTLLCEQDYDNFNSVISDRSLDIRKEVTPSFERAIFSRFREQGRHNGNSHSYSQHHGSQHNRGKFQHRRFNSGRVK